MITNILAQAVENSSGAPPISTKDILIFLAAIITGVLTYLGTKATSNAQERSASIQNRGPEWQSFVEKLESTYEKNIEDLKTRHDELIKDLEEKHAQAIEEIKNQYEKENTALNERIQKLEVDMDEVKSDLDDLSNKYDTAISYIRVIKTESPKVTEEYPIPESIKSDV